MPDNLLTVPTSLSRHRWVGVLVCVVAGFRVKSVVWLSRHRLIGFLVCVAEGVLVACVGRRADCFISGALAVVRKMTAAMYALVNQLVIQSDPPQK